MPLPAALAILAPIAIAGFQQFLEHKTEMARIDAGRDVTMVGIATAGVLGIALLTAHQAHHRTSLENLVAALNTAVENDEPDHASELIHELREQLNRKTPTEDLRIVAERAIEAAMRHFDGSTCTSSSPAHVPGQFPPA